MNPYKTVSDLLNDRETETLSNPLVLFLCAISLLLAACYYCWFVSEHKRLRTSASIPPPATDDSSQEQTENLTSKLIYLESVLKVVEKGDIDSETSSVESSVRP